MNEEARRFRSNIHFELALKNLLGRRYCGCASAFEDVQITKKFLLRALNRIGRRLNEIITTDERLTLTTSIALDNLRDDVKATSEKTNRDWFIIANLLNLVALLLGYDLLDGRIHRHIMFYQDREQETEEYRKMVGGAFWDEFPHGDLRVRYELVYRLKQRKLPRNQIARVLGISYVMVTKILKRIDEFERNSGKNFLKYLDELPRQFFRPL